MAHNSRIRAPGMWTDLSVLTAGECEAIDAAQFAAVNGDGGGTYAPPAQIILGGTGLWVTGPSRLDDAQVTITAGKSLTIAGVLGNLAVLALGQYVIATDAATWFRAGTETWVSTGVVNFQSGAQANFALGSTLNVSGQANFLSGSFCSIQSGAQFKVFAGGDALFLGDSTTTVNGTSGHSALWSFGPFSTCVWTGSCLDAGTWARQGTETWASGGTVIYQSGSILTNGATQTRTGPEVLSGASATTKDRQALGPAVDSTIDTDACDYLLLPVGLTGDINYILGAPTGNSNFTIAQTSSNQGAAVQIFSNNGTTKIGNFLNSSGRLDATVKYRFDGTRWRPTTWTLPEQPLIHTGDSALAMP